MVLKDKKFNSDELLDSNMYITMKEFITISFRRQPPASDYVMNKSYCI